MGRREERGKREEEGGEGRRGRRRREERGKGPCSWRSANPVDGMYLGGF